MNRLEQLTQRYDRLQRLRDLAIKQNNIYKKNQAEFLINALTITLNLIAEPKSWN